MKTRYALAKSAAVLAIILAFAVAAISAPPAKRTPTKRAPNFNAVTSPDAAPTFRTGIVVKVKSASIAADGTITARAVITDPAGAPLDRLGIDTAGTVAISMICAVIPAGKAQYTSYTTTTLAATINKNPSQIQAANDSGGTFTQNGPGDYTYVFKTKAPTGFDKTVTHSIGVSAVRNLAEFGTFEEWANVSNDVFTFVPDGSPVKVTRDVVATKACNGCHNPLIGHGGSRIKVELCVMCHQPQTVNPDTQLTQDMPVLIHKIHMGSSLPSVKAGSPYRIWHRGAWSDFSEVTFPQRVANCEACHTKGPAQANNYLTNPSRAACGACHDNVNFATGENHVSLPQVTDGQCKNCHTTEAAYDFDASIPGAHQDPIRSASLPGIVVAIQKIANATPGNAPVVTFKVTDKAGTPLDISKLASIRVIMVGPNVDLGVMPEGMARVSEDPSKTAGANGVYSYTMTAKIPATSKGSFTVAIEARNTVKLLAGTLKARDAVDAAIPVQMAFAVDNSKVAARRQVVSNDKCNACHQSLGFIHGGGRPLAQECTLCHNPTLVDGTSKTTVNFATQIHSIHRGKDLANPYVIAGVNYQDVGFPGDLKDCTTCHLPGTYQADKVGAVAPVQTPGGFTPTTMPIAAACLGCHDSKTAASHALANTTAIGEACAACHGSSSEFSADKVHSRK